MRHVVLVERGESEGNEGGFPSEEDTIVLPRCNRSTTERREVDGREVKDDDAEEEDWKSVTAACCGGGRRA